MDVSNDLTNILKPNEVILLINGYLRGELNGYNIINGIYFIVRKYYFPNEDIGLKMNDIGYIKRNVPVFYANNINSCRKTEKSQLFAVRSPIPYYMKNNFCVLILVKFVDQDDIKDFSDDDFFRYLEKDPVLVQWKDTDLFDPKLRYVYNIESWKECVNSNEYISVDRAGHDSIKSLSKNHSDRSYGGMFNRKTRFKLIKPDYILDRNWDTFYINQPIYCQFTKTGKYGYLYLHNTSIIFDIAKQRMKYYGIETDNIDVNDSKYIKLSVKGVGMYSLDCFDAPVQSYKAPFNDPISLVLLDNKVYHCWKYNIDRFIPVKCIDKKYPIYNICFWLFLNKDVIKQYRDRILDIKYKQYVYEWNTNLNDIIINDSQYINCNYGYITNLCNTYDEIKFYESQSHPFLGKFYKHNKFKILDNKIYNFDDIQYIKVRLIYSDIYYDNIDLSLIDKDVYININNTNHRRINTHYYECIKLIQDFKENGKNVTEYKKGTILRKNTWLDVRLYASYHNLFGDTKNDKYCGYLTTNDEIYLISPEHNKVRYGDWVCVYSKKYDYIGWMSSVYTTFPLIDITLSDVIHKPAINLFDIMTKDCDRINIYASIKPMKMIELHDRTDLNHVWRNSLIKVKVKLIKSIKLGNECFARVIFCDNQNDRYKNYYGLCFWIEIASKYYNAIN